MIPPVPKCRGNSRPWGQNRRSGKRAAHLPPHPKIPRKAAPEPKLLIAIKEVVEFFRDRKL